VPFSVKPTLALSTAWCSHRHTDGYAMLREMADFGFEYVELSHGIRITLVPGILKGLEEGVIKVGSTHNFCPLPPGIMQAAPNLYEPSTPDGQERDQWLRHTKRSIDFAVQVGASVMVCHLGSVVFFWFNPARKIQQFLGSHPQATASDPGLRDLLADSMGKLRKRMGPYWERTRAGIKDALAYAAVKGIKLGLENREKFEELPVDADFPEFLAGLADAPCGYWHDVGHAQIKQNMGLIDHRRQLEQNAARLIGFHLHDVNAEGHDHQGVGTGKIDFGMVSSFWRPHHRLVLELGPRVTVEELIASKARIEELL
jgi:sugar phosphate isomerase/epimerase